MPDNESFDLEDDQGTTSWTLTGASVPLAPAHREPELGARIRGELPRIELSSVLFEGLRAVVEQYLRIWSPPDNAEDFHFWYRVEEKRTTERRRHLEVSNSVAAASAVTVVARAFLGSFKAEIRFPHPSRADKGSYDISYAGTHLARGRLRTLLAALLEFTGRPGFTQPPPSTAICRVTLTSKLPPMKLDWDDLQALEELLSSSAPAGTFDRHYGGLSHERIVRLTTNNNTSYSAERLDLLEREHSRFALLGSDTREAEIEHIFSSGTHSPGIAVSVHLGPTPVHSRLVIVCEHENALALAESIEGRVLALCKTKRSHILSHLHNKYTTGTLLVAITTYTTTLATLLDYDVFLTATSTFFLGILLGRWLIEQRYAYTFIEMTTSNRLTASFRQHAVLLCIVLLAPLTLLLT